MSALRLPRRAAGVLDAVRRPGPLPYGIRLLVGAGLFVVAVELIFSTSLPDFVSGVALGSLYGIIGVGLVLIYRTARIINFAAGAVGAIPAIIALTLVLQFHVNYPLTLPIILVGGPALGALSDLLVMRRFDKAPRIIATVITIGIAQSFAVLGFFIPVWFGEKANNEGALVSTPWQNLVWHNSHGQPVITGNEVAAVAVVVLLTIGLAAFLRYTRLGIALRASAENSERASLLGIPVRRISLAAWALAGLLSAVAIFVQAPLIGAPSDATLGFDTLLYGLAAAVVARMEHLGLTLVAGMGIGVLITSTVVSSGDTSVASSIMVLVILGALLTQPRQSMRARDTGEGTWQTVKQYRPIPSELRRVPEVVAVRWAMPLAGAGVMVALPYLAGADNLSYLIQLPLYGIVAVSLVVLTGWAGQISLGQFGLVGVAAGVAGGLVANHNIDFFAAMAIGIGTGVVVAIVVGLPALRIQGLYLAATTLAFGYAVPNYILNEHYWIGRHLLPSGLAAHLYRPLLYGRIDLSSDRAFYYLCVVFLAAVMLGAYSFRRNRSGRVLIAQRDNQRAVTAYGVNPTRTRLAAFAVSGGIAGAAGVLFDYAQQNVVPGTYDIQASLTVFLAVALAGMTSVSYAVLGAMVLETTVVFGPRLYDLFHSTTITSVLPLLVTGPLLILNSYFYPGGSAEAGIRLRDKWLRRIAQRRGIAVPALAGEGDVRLTGAELTATLESEASVLETARDHLAHVGSTDGGAPLWRTEAAEK